MTDTVTTPVVDESAQAMQSAQAGYDGKARAQAPAPEVQNVPAQPLAETAPAASPKDPEEELTPPAEADKPSPITAVSTQLDDLKAQIRELKEGGADAATVRKMHGEIGELNRSLKQLTALQKAEAPAVDELAAALADAEAKAAEYPEIYGPLLKTLKVMQARMGQPAAPETAQPPTEAAKPAETVVDPAEQARVATQTAAIKALDEVHPDRHLIRQSPEFQAWLKAKPPEYQKRVTTSWNPAVVAEPFTDFKAFKAKQAKNQQRLDAAVTEKGVPRTEPTTLPDEAGAQRGYARRASARR